MTSSDNDTTSPTARPGQTDADALVHARWLLTVCPDNRVLEHHSLVIRDQKIIDILQTEDAEERYRASNEYRLEHHVLLPGLINSHCHSPMVLLRGYADDMALQPWLREKIWPAEGRWVSEQFVAEGAEIAIGEMLLSGITCFSDMYFYPDQIARAATRAGMRVQLASPVFDFATSWAQDAEECIRKATQLHDEFRNAPTVTTAFGPHAPYTVADPALRKIAELSDELDIPVHIHLHENQAEIDEALDESGKRPLQRLLEMGLVNPHLQAVHATRIDEEEIELFATHGVHVVHCPASNLKLASGFCPVAQLQDAGVNVCLGTDGAASNNRLDILREMQVATLIAKAVSGNAEVLPAQQSLRCATINGARALGLEEQTGSLEIGKYADMIAVDLSQLNTQPLYNPVSALAYSARASQVSHVWVNGSLSVRDGRLQHLDIEQLQSNALQWAEKIGQSS